MLERGRRVAQHDAQTLFDVAVEKLMSAADQIVDLGKVTADEANHDGVFTVHREFIATALDPHARDAGHRVQMGVARAEDFAGEVHVFKGYFLNFHASSYFGRIVSNLRIPL